MCILWHPGKIKYKFAYFFCSNHHPHDGTGNVAPGMSFTAYKQPWMTKPTISERQIPQSAARAPIGIASSINSGVMAAALNAPFPEDINLKPCTYTAPPKRPTTKQRPRRLLLYHQCSAALREKNTRRKNCAMLIHHKVGIPGLHIVPDDREKNTPPW